METLKDGQILLGEAVDRGTTFTDEIIRRQDAQIKNLKRELVHANRKLSQAEQAIDWNEGTINSLKRTIEEMKTK